MLFEKRKEWNSAVISRDMANVGSKTELSQGKMPLVIRGRRCEIYILDCKETKHWRLKLIHDEWVNVNKEVAYGNIMKITNKTHLQSLWKYLDIV